MKFSNKIFTYNVEFMRYTSQLRWDNSVLFHCYYQSFLKRIQNSILTQKQEKPFLFQTMYSLVLTINNQYWKYNWEHICVQTTKKDIVNAHAQKQQYFTSRTSFISTTIIWPQNLLAVLFANFSWPSSSTPAPLSRSLSS